MKPLHAHDISADALAAIYELPLSVLPASLHMDAYETLQCIAFQCNGFIKNESGTDLSRPIALDAEYWFVGAYFDSDQAMARCPSAPVHVATVLHEFAHFLDGLVRSPYADQPLSHSIDTSGFYAITFEIPANPTQVACAPRRTDDVFDFVSRYGWGSSYDCAEGLFRPTEEFAEAFSFYVVAGQHFRAASEQRPTIAAEYEWLKENVFDGIEYDTANPVAYNSGCNDAPGLEDREPAHFSCSEDAVWDWTLPVLAQPRIEPKAKRPGRSYSAR